MAHREVTGATHPKCVTLGASDALGSCQRRLLNGARRSDRSHSPQVCDLGGFRRPRFLPEETPEWRTEK